MFCLWSQWIFFLDGLQPSSSHDFLHWGCHNPVVGQFCSSDAMMMLNPLKSNILRHPKIRVPDISYIYIYQYMYTQLYTYCTLKYNFIQFMYHGHNYTQFELSKIIQMHPHHVFPFPWAPRWSPQGRSICFSPAMSPTTKAGDRLRGFLFFFWRLGDFRSNKSNFNNQNLGFDGMFDGIILDLYSD